MEIKINIEQLKKTVADMDMIMKGNVLHQLDSLLVTAKDGVITVTANNLNIKVCKRVPGDVLFDGSVLLHRDNLAMLLKMKGAAMLSFSGHQCTVEGSRLFRFVVAEDADEFPLTPEAPDAMRNFTIPENELLYCLKLRRLMAASEKLNLQGIWIDNNNLYACDGYKIGLIETEHHAEKRFMIPDFAVNYLLKALDKKSCLPVVFSVSEKGNVTAVSNSFEITYRQYDGDYALNYDMFNVDSAQTAVLRKQDLASTLDFMCEVYRTSHRGKRKPVESVVYTFCDGRLKLAYTTSGRYVEDEIPVERLDADVNFKIGFQPLHNSELLSMIDGDEITMNLDRPLSPAVICGEKENEKFLMCPVRLDSAA